MQNNTTIMDMNVKALEELEIDLIMNATDLDPNDLFMENHLETIEHDDDNNLEENKNIRKVQSIMQKIKMQNIFTKYRCPQCKIEVLSKRQLEEHIQKKHGPLQCKRCKKIFTTEEDYAAHIEVDHAGVVEFGEVCKDCGKTFVSKQTMKAHVLSKCGTEKQFKCEICGQAYMSKLSLNSHKAIHDGKKYFCCSYCGKQFISHGELKVHERMHTKEKPFQCNVCHKSFSYRESLVTHSSIHTGIKPYLCILCGKTFSCVGNLLKHRRSKPSSCGLPQFCEKIERVAPRIGTKAAHKNHPSPEVYFPKERKDDTNFTIEEWNETIELDEFEANWSKTSNECSNDGQIEIYIANESVDNQPEFHQQCGSDNNKQSETKFGNIVDYNTDFDESRVELITMTENNSLQDSTNEQIKVEFIESNADNAIEVDPVASAADNIKGDAIEELYECTLCHLEFTSTDLINHLNNSHSAESTEEEQESEYQDPTEDPIILCLHCDARFYQQTEYYKHLKTHTDNKQSNSLIGSTDESNDTIIKTKDQVLAACATINYVCTKCGKKCYSRSSLREHERSKCGTKLVNQCGTCKKYYYSLASLKRHITVHTGEMPYLCSDCGKPFRTKGQYVVHMRRHTGEKPYACNLCPKAFSYRQSLVTHITTHTGEKPFVCYCGKTFSCVKNLQSHRNTFNTTCGKLPLNTKPVISIGVIKGQLYIGENSD